MKTILKPVTSILMMCLLAACMNEATMEPVVEHAENAPPEERGPNNGFMLRDDDFSIELAIFETGVPPEYRAWAREGDTLLSPGSVSLQVELTRLGGVVNQIDFAPQGDMLRGNATIYEPHSFSVHITAVRNGRTHQWSYDSFEGRTAIEPAVQEALGIETEIAGPATIKETIPAYGKVLANSQNEAQVMARFEGQISSVHTSLGSRVRAGERLATIESNQSLAPYTVTAPISGEIVAMQAVAGTQTAGRTLFIIRNTDSVWVDLAIFPADQPRIRPGTPVQLHTGTSETPLQGQVERFLPTASANQSLTARVVMDNRDGLLTPGLWVDASLEVAEFEVPLAVKRVGLQSFRDFTVVYAQVGNEFEVRMLELGRQDDTWIEVLGGLNSGTRYVTENSYILKADVEKSGASHDH